MNWSPVFHLQWLSHVPHGRQHLPTTIVWNSPMRELISSAMVSSPLLPAFGTLSLLYFRLPSTFQSLRYSSFGVVGPRLFNVLPVNIRNISGCTVETFKLHLDRFLATVPDEPQVRGYTAMRRAESNSLLHMAQLAGPQRV